MFADKSASLYTSVPYDDNELQKIISEVDSQFSDNALSQISECIVTCRDVKSAIENLNAHKNDGNLGICTDHFINGGDDLSVHIALLFSCINVHGYVPSDFSASTIIPIPKKSNADTSSSDNFRGIALSSVFCKILDNVILHKFQDKLNSCDLQFGFKRKSSTHMCTMVLKETLAYYNSNQTSVFCTFLDASKAFDRINYCKLFRFLLERKLPAVVIRVLISLLTGHMVRVSWAGFASDYFKALNGVKQGGIISPVLFCVYIDQLLINLASSGVGCYVGLNFVGALAYADDIVLLAPTPTAMRKLLSICDIYALNMTLYLMQLNLNFWLLFQASEDLCKTY